MGRKSKSVVSTRPQLRHANRIRSALDVAIIAAGEAHPMRWPRGLLTTIAQQHNVSVSHAHGRRRNLLPGVSSANGTIWCVNEFLQILFTSYCKSWCLTLENQRITWCRQLTIYLIIFLPWREVNPRILYLDPNLWFCSHQYQLTTDRRNLSRDSPRKISQRVVMSMK